jgi:PAS domain S-box-containing protein
MKWGNTSIDRKVTLTTLATTGIALVLAAGSLIGYELTTLRQTIHERVELLGRIVASNSTAALAFQNLPDATAVLGSLRSEKTITGAALYDADGALFASYPPERAVKSLPARAGSGSHFVNHRLEVFAPAVEAGVRVGTLYLESELGELDERARLYAAIVGAVAVLALLVAWLVARPLQRSISGPILSLVQTAQTISRDRDYGVRAPKWSDDDLGILTDAVNHMLDRTQEQERGLRRSQERFAIAVSGSSDGLWDWMGPPDGNVWWSPRFRELLSMPAGDEFGTAQEFFDRLSPEASAGFHTAMQNHFESGAPFQFEFSTGEEASPRWFRMRGRAIRDHAGTVARFAGSLSDITLRTNLQKAMRASEQKYLDLFENAPDMYLTVEVLSGRIIESNRTLATMLGVARDEVPGIPFRDLFDDASRGAAAEALVTLREEGSVQDVELVLRARSGDSIATVMNVSAVQDATDTITHGRVVLRDNREQKRTERKLRHYADVLAQSNRDLDDFAYAASHDLRAPLRAIDNLAQWIEDDVGPSLPAEGVRHLQRMRQRVNRMDRLLDDLLQYSRVGRNLGNLEPVDAHELVEEIVDMLAPASPFRVVVEKPLPSLLTYRAPLRQVFLNLVVNAIEHHDRADGCVAIRARDLGEFVEFEVADDGPGIAPEHHERVFRMFQTLVPRDHKEASGIGLALVKKTVEGHQGRVTLHSSESGGAAFSFTWPKSERVVAEA